MITSRKEVYAKILPFVKKSNGNNSSSNPGANILGLHLEGPFISPEKKGAHKIEYIQDLKGGFPNLLDVYGGNLQDVSIITLAPELDDLDCSVIKECTKNGVTISIGHSAATLKQAEAAFRSGARLITHLFNAMTVFHHRADPGIMGVLTSKKLDDHTAYYGLIADGIHTHPTALRCCFSVDQFTVF